MCMPGTNRADDIKTRMRMYSTMKKSTLSFAEECARLCGQDERKCGVLSTPAYQTRNQKIDERYYHVQDPKTVRYAHISKSTRGWIKVKSETGNGIRHHYNFRLIRL